MKKNGKGFYFKLNDKDFHCAMDVTMSFIGGKWKTVVLWYLINKTFRFSELKKMIPNITEKMLSIQLKALEGDGLIHRKVYPVVPPKVEYSMTEKGKSLIPLLKEMAKWGRKLVKEEGQILKIDID